PRRLCAPDSAPALASARPRPPHAAPDSGAASGEGPSRLVHIGQRRALTGIALVHSGHSLVSGSACARRASSALIGATTRKNTAAAIVTNASRLLMKSPYWNWLWLIVNDSAPKFGLPKISAMM